MCVTKCDPLTGCSAEEKCLCDGDCGYSCVKRGKYTIRKLLVGTNVKEKKTRHHNEIPHFFQASFLQLLKLQLNFVTFGSL